MSIDLHTHSRTSDGTTTPAEVVSAAASAGLSVLALTDHDTVGGWDEAAAAAERHGVSLVRGIEISTKRDGHSLHLLGYLTDPERGGLMAELERSRRSRATRFDTMVQKMAAGGLPLTLESVRRQVASGATLGRPHIADALIAAGVVADREEAFDGFLSHHSPYYVRYHSPDVADAVRLVLDAGGVPVLAHPFSDRRSRATDALIDELVAVGLAGIEAHHREHSPESVARAVALAERHGLLVTGSSDYHGVGKPNRIGENTTAEAVLDEIVERAREAGGLPLLTP